MNNTAGSWALLCANNKVSRDATVTYKLRAAGAVILGKTSLSEWANWRSHFGNSSNGWSGLGGQVYGPYFPNQDPLGSSSGSAIASALGLAPGSLGTETGGSIIGPSSHNNLVGVKPTVGLTSRHMVMPVSEHQDTVGPLTRTVKDAAYLLQTIAGFDPRDNYTSAIPGGTTQDYVSACKLSGLAGMRIGVPRNVMSLKSDNITGSRVETFDKALAVLRDAGATIVEDANFTAAAKFMGSRLSRVILNADLMVNLQSYLESLTYNPLNITSLGDLREFTQSSSLEEFPLRDTGLWDDALNGWNNTDPRFWPLYQQNLYYGDEGGLLGTLERLHLDAVTLPSLFAPEWVMTVGSPIVTVPLGSFPARTPVTYSSWDLAFVAPNIPFGISFLGSRFSEVKLIGMAYAFEQRTKIRDTIRPYIIPHTELVDVVGK